MTETGRTAAQGNFSFGEARAASHRSFFKPEIVPFSRKT